MAGLLGIGRIFTKREEEEAKRIRASWAWPQGEFHPS
jgi:hypothetical protein